jgi:hypothetical protein
MSDYTTHDEAYAFALQRPAQPLEHLMPSGWPRYHAYRYEAMWGGGKESRVWIDGREIGTSPRGFRPPSAAFEHHPRCR